MITLTFADGSTFDVEEVNEESETLRFLIKGSDISEYQKIFCDTTKTATISWDEASYSGLVFKYMTTQCELDSDMSIIMYTHVQFTIPTIATLGDNVQTLTKNLDETNETIASSTEEILMTIDTILTDIIPSMLDDIVSTESEGE